MQKTTLQQALRIASVEDIPLGEGRCVTVRGERIALFRLENGECLAVAHRCPHREGPLADGIVAGETVTCPLHNWKVHLRTGEVLGEDRWVKTYPVRVEAGSVYLLVEGRPETP